MRGGTSEAAPSAVVTPSAVTGWKVVLSSVIQWAAAEAVQPGVRAGQQGDSLEVLCSSQPLLRTTAISSEQKGEAAALLS